MRKIYMIIFSLIVMAVLTLPVYSEYDRDNIDNNDQTAKYYDNAKVVRVKFVRGESFVNRSYNEGVEEATVNLSIFEGDSAGTTDGRMEIYLGKLNYLRLDSDTEVKFVNVPELRRTKTTLYLKKGGIYLDISNLDDEKDIVVQTEDCGFFVLKRGLYRINASENGKTEIYVYNGLAEVAGNDYHRNVRENQKTVMRNGGVIERPFYFYATNEDDFDDWNKTRMGSYEHQKYSTARYLNEGFEDQEYELTRSGRWEYNSEYSTNVWMPYNISSSWRPYSNGRWVWHPVYGYVWNSYDTWGHYTHHYGRWHWSNMNGWYWLPGYRWSPAWVSWCGSSAFWGWSPLSYYNRPVVVINGRWNRGYRYRNGIPWKSRSMIIIKKSHLMNPRINKVSLKRAGLSRIKKGNIKYRGIAPKIKPINRTVPVINSRGDRIAYKKGGILSYKRIQKKGKTSVYKRAKASAVNKYKRTSPVRKSSYKYSSKIKKYKPSYKYSSKSKNKSNTKYTGKTVYKTSPVKSSTSKYKYKGTTKKKYSAPKTPYKGSTNIKKIKKKSSAPYSYKSRDSYRGSSYKSSKTYSSKSSKGSSYTYKPYSSKTYKSKPYKSSSSGNKSYSRPSYKSSSKYKSSSSKSYSSPKKSYKGYSKPSSSYKRSSSGSKSSSSYRSSPKSSSSSSSSSSKSSRKKK